VTANKLALVTGAGVRVGHAIALALADAGMDVAVHYAHSAEEANSTVAEIRKRGRKSDAFAAELDRAGEPEKLIDSVVAKMGAPDVLVNSAAIMQRTPLENRWASERWDPIAVVPVPSGAAQGATPAAPPVCVSDDDTCTQWRFDGHARELHRSEAEGYYLNLVAPDPKVFVAWRTHDDPTVPPVFPVMVTVSYNEAARMMDGGERVDAVPLPEPVREWMTPFIAEHYKPEPRRKVRRNDPFAADTPHRDRGPRG
jgi:hypothetical protein